jgi:Ca-activated chloride channel homolog
MSLAFHAPLLALLSTLPLFDSPGTYGPVARPTARPVVRPAAGPVHFRSLRAEVRIVEGVATNRAVIQLENEGTRQEEAWWILPLGEGAVADDFRMRTGGTELQGEVLDARRAQGVYEEIVRARRDPGLLEHFGRGCLRARIFPVPPQGELEVEVSWREILPEVGGLRRWSFPIAAAGIGGAPPESAALDLTIESSRALLNVFSTTPGLEVLRDGDHRAHASFEFSGAALPARELTVLHALTDREFGLDVLSTRPPGAELGTFLMLLSPRRDVAEMKSMPRSIVFALDVSGSMMNRKIEQARASVRFFVSALQPEDEFNVVPFSTEARPFFPAPMTANAANLEEALRRLEQLKAEGGTNFEDALRVSLSGMRADPGRVPIVVLLTDGLPNVGEDTPGKLLELGRTWNQARARTFVLGVGDDVNTTLLDRMAEEYGGTRTYVRPDEDIEVAASGLFEALSHPVMTDLELAVEGAQVERVVPRRLPDLFHGGRLIIAGQYRGAGPCKVRLTGTVAGERKTFDYDATLSAQPVAAFDFVPVLYAERRVASLLDEIRLHGDDPELVGEIQRLGTEFNLVTPYTSHLIVEQGLGVPVAGGSYRGPSDTTPPGAPGVGGPGTPGPSGPNAPGPAAPGTPMGGPGAAATQGGSWSAEIDVVEVLAQRLREAGVMPDSAPPAELRKLAQDVASEMRASAAGLQGLGRDASGRKAVEDSVWLERRLNTGAVRGGSSDFFTGSTTRTTAQDLLALFTCKVKDKTFVLRKGVWVQRELADKELSPVRVVLEAYSKPWFDKLIEKPALRLYFAFTTRLVLELDGVVYEVKPPATPDSETAAATEEKR